MSESVQNVEIEDVLSSIRKLVAADPKPEKTNMDEGAGPAGAGPRLILTPAQRITMPLPEAQNVPEESSNATDAEEAEWNAAREEEISAADPEDLMEEAAEHEEPAYETSEGDEAEVFDAPVDQALSEESEPDEGEMFETAHVEAGEAEYDALSDMQGDDDRDDDDLSDDIGEAFEPEVDVPAFLLRQPEAVPAEAEPAEVQEMQEPVGDLTGEEERESGDAAAPQDDTFAALSALAQELSQPAGEVHLEDATSEEREPHAENAPPKTSNLEILVARAANVEEALSRQPDEWEPDDPTHETLGADELEPLPWQDIEEELEGVAGQAEPARNDPQLEGEAIRTEEHHSTAQAPRGEMADLARDDEDWFDPASVLDEDALRDMVSEIVREELQGALGERITRNVRKLVRREIHRALVAQGIE